MGYPVLRRFRIGLFLVTLTPVTLGLIPLQALLISLNHPAALRLPRFYHRFVARLLGIRVKVHGRPLPKGARLFIANHMSWIDIVVLGSLLPLTFIARADMAQWPIFGLLARLQRTIFVDRTRKMATGSAIRSISERFADQEAVLLFAEGTTSDGHRVLPFRSALLGAVSGAALDHEATAQPVALAYQRRHGLPIARYARPDIAWYGDMTILPHLNGIIAGGPIEVDVWFGDPYPLERMADRKALAGLAQRQIRAAVALLSRNRERPFVWPQG